MHARSFAKEFQALEGLFLLFLYWLGVSILPFCALNISQIWGDQIKLFLSSRVKKLETPNQIRRSIWTFWWERNTCAWWPKDVFATWLPNNTRTTSLIMICLGNVFLSYAFNALNALTVYPQTRKSSRRRGRTSPQEYARSDASAPLSPLTYRSRLLFRPHLSSSSLCWSTPRPSRLAAGASCPPVHFFRVPPLDGP